MIQPIWQVLADLGIEGDYCQSAVSAVEKVTTQHFQIVVTDWEDQPEAAFLLKTVRDLKAAQRPLTLAIVSNDASRPEALQAGANSILLKPIRAEQVRDTLSTACELLRSKLQPAASAPPHEPAGKAALGAAASSGTASAPVSVSKSPEYIPAEVAQQLPGSIPRILGANSNSEVETPEEPTVMRVEPPTELESSSPALETSSPLEQKQPEILTGWSMLQARLTTSAPSTAGGAPAKNELLSYDDPSHGTRSEKLPADEYKAPAKRQSPQHTESEAVLFSYISGGSAQDSKPTATDKPRRGKVFLIVGFVIVCAGLAATPRVRQLSRSLYRNSARAVSRLLNPPPAPLPQAVAVHDSFGQSGDEYKLPVPTTIPDATTDPSQIRVLPVVDPTAKLQKSADANSATEPAPAAETPPTDQNPSATIGDVPGSAAGNDVKASAPPNPENTPDRQVDSVPDVVPMQTRPVPTRPVPTRPVQATVPQAPVTSNSQPPHVVSAAVSAGIPSSLKSQVASTTPQSSGSKPIEAAMSSIEPVNLPELVARDFLAQPVDPAYPPAAKASGQRGSVVLQVLIGRDGTVQDAKFLQGSLVFARAAIDAMKQWRFKPYLLNGRAVSVQTAITLNFKPPA